jgi:hypothetical protein
LKRGNKDYLAYIRRCRLQRSHLRKGIETFRQRPAGPD